MSVVHFGEEPFAVRLMPLEGPDKEIGEVCPLLAVENDKGLVVRDREMFWWPLKRMRVVLQPEVTETPQRLEADRIRGIEPFDTHAGDED